MQPDSKFLSNTGFLRHSSMYGVEFLWFLFDFVAEEDENLQGFSMGNIVERLLIAWSNATLYDYTFTVVWIILVGFLVGKASRFNL